MCAGAALGLVSLSDKRESLVTFTASELTKTYLLPNSEVSLEGYVLHSNDVLYPLWANLDASVEKGSHCWEETFGQHQAEVFANLYADSRKLKVRQQTLQVLFVDSVVSGL